MNNISWSNVISVGGSSDIMVPSVSGLYMFLGEMKGNDMYDVVYIGETDDLNRRYKEYLNGANSCVSKNAKNLVYAIETNVFSRREKEKELIQYYRPMCNIEYKY